MFLDNRVHCRLSRGGRHFTVSKYCFSAKRSPAPHTARKKTKQINRTCNSMIKWIMNRTQPWINRRWTMSAFGFSLLLSSPLSVFAQRLDPPLFLPVPRQRLRPVQQPPIKSRVIKRIVTKPVATKVQLNQALIAEAFHGSAAHVAGLLAQGADPNAKGLAATPALCYAVAAKNSAVTKSGVVKSISVVTLLLSHGAHINAADGRGNTALTEAVGLKAEALVVLLLRHGANPNVRNAAGFTPLGIATVNSDIPLMHLLIAHGASLNAPQQKGMTPLALAAALEHPEAVRLLLGAGSPANATSERSPSPLMIALAGSRRAGVSPQNADAALLALLDHGASPNVRGADGSMPLLVSAALGDLTASRLLVEHGAAVNAPNTLGRTALTIASAQGNVPLVHLLLTNKAAVNVQDKAGNTPLLWAVRGRHAGIADELLWAGAKASQANRQGLTPLMAACYQGNQSLAALLVDKGASVKAADRTGYTALILAVHSGSASLVKMLIEHGADVNAKTAQGATALNYATGHKALLALLLPRVAKTGLPKSPADGAKPQAPLVPMASSIPAAGSQSVPQVPQAGGAEATPPSIMHLPTGPSVSGASEPPRLLGQP